MRFNLGQLTLQEKLFEFDIWVTAKLGEIKDTNRFNHELGKIVQIIEILGEATNNFNSVQEISAERIAEIVLSKIKDLSPVESFAILDSLAAFLFLITGKSDNNAKCQLPLYLRDHVEGIPIDKNGELKIKKLPRTIKAQDYMVAVCRIKGHEEEAKRLLLQFIEFILSDEPSVSQLWSVGYSYFALRQFGKERDLITPIIIFQVRGSVTASGGHEPEGLLRDLMREWGLTSGVDFNSNDVPLSELEQIKKDKDELEAVRESEKIYETEESIPEASSGIEEGEEKERAYDFVLPYKVQEWEPQIFVQCQFYAGDSGSVSHKNVDQTDSSRRKTTEIFDQAKFVEYVDGAGYYSALNGDLKKLLQMPDTYTFIQINTSPVKLRNALQEIGFLTLLEIEHAILKSNGTTEEVWRILQEEGYSAEEIERAIKAAYTNKQLVIDGDRLQIFDERRILARRYLVLDVIAIYGEKLDKDNLRGKALVPGFGVFYGLGVQKVIEMALEIVPNIRQDYIDNQTFEEDLKYLVEKGYIKLG